MPGDPLSRFLAIIHLQNLLADDYPSEPDAKVIPGDENTPPVGYETSRWGYVRARVRIVYDATCPEDLTRVIKSLPKFHPAEYHHCPYCRGWIAGAPDEREVDNLAPQHLAGRRGTAYRCRKCGREIAFMGMMS